VEIPISDACATALDELRSRLIVGSHVFLGETSRPISINSIRRYFALAKKLAGIERRCRFHDLRHAFGSRLASAGVSIQVIAKVMGHSTVRVTERYARPSASAMAGILTALASSDAFQDAACSDR